MAKFRVMVTKYGFTVVDAETASQAEELAENMSDNDFDWSDFGDAEIIDEGEDLC